MTKSWCTHLQYWDSYTSLVPHYVSSPRNKSVNCMNMKVITLILLILVGQITYSEELIRVDPSLNNRCGEFGCMYDEWKLKSDESIRFVISGYEDGADNRFYRVSESGEYSVILDVSSIITDSKGKYWWGYAWDIKDIPIEYKDNQVYVYATFEHDQIRDGNYNPPKWQKSFPVVKFYGEKTRWNIEQPKYEYNLVSLQALAESAKQLTSRSKAMQKSAF